MDALRSSLLITRGHHGAADRAVRRSEAVPDVGMEQV
jgi:hypothetical protein